jgi:signal transduction histidine kinase/PAS domain-containing protein/ActR/RegA family two-component response regulator
MMRQATGRVFPYFIAAASLGFAMGVRLVIDPALGSIQPLTTFYLAVAITAWFSGFWPAIVVTLVGYVVADWFFIAPRYELGFLSPRIHVLVGAPIYFLVGAVIAGVTESLRRAERRADEKARELAEKVRESAERAADLQALFDAAPIGIWVAHDAACQRITGNRFADQLLGVPIGANVSLSAPPDQRAVPLRALKEGRELKPGDLPLQVAARTGRPAVNSEFDFVFEDGRTISLAGGAAPLKDVDGRVRGAIVAMRDVSAEKRAKEQSAAACAEAEKFAETLRRVQRITDAMLEDLPPDKQLHEVLIRVQEALAADVAILLVGKREKGREVVLRVRAIIGMPGIEIGSVAPRRGFGPEVAKERRAKVWSDVDVENRFTRLFGGTVRSLAGVPLMLGENLLGVLEVANLQPGKFTDEDVNLLRLAGERIALGIERAARQDAERQIRESLEASNRAKDEFLAMLSHELRNPLSAVRNAVATISPDEVRRPRALEIARRQAEQLGRLIDDLLDVARITRGRIALRKEHVNLAEIIDRSVESVRPLTEERGVRLIVADTPAAIRVKADPARLEQVFVNLLSNAAKYTEAGGRIDITIERQGDEVAVHVRDTGIGIAPEMLPRIWDLFAQGDRTLERPQGGLGIGLTLTRRLVELHGGKIEAHSEGPGKGAEFVVRLPALPVATGESLPSVAPQPSAERCARVLVVEDNPDTAESLTMFLEGLGHHVRAVYDGMAALDAAHTSPPDVMLVDIGLPGMDGYELARRVRRDPGLDRVALIALTGYGREEDKRQAIAAGFDHHLVKPVSPEALHELVRRLGRVETAKHTVH